MERPDLTGPRRAVFLDRDGVLIEDVGYQTDPRQLRILPGVPAALKNLREAGFLLIVVTNQSAVARGWLTEEGLAAIHRRLNDELRAAGAEVDAFFYCPHLPDGEVRAYARVCACRKPKAGMLRQAAREWQIALERSYMVGDSERDVEAGRRAGCYTISVGAQPADNADACAADLAAATDLILRRERIRGTGTCPG